MDFLESIDAQIQDLNDVRTFLDDGGDVSNISEKFQTAYPKLYAGIVSGTVKLDKLVEYKLEWKQVYVETDGTHDDKKYAADKRVGMKLAKIFLFPTKGTPSYKELKRANKALKQKLNKPIEVKSREELKKTMTLKPL